MAKNVHWKIHILEKIARNKSNDYEVEINKVEQSDEYIKAQAMDDYLKKK